MPVALVRRLVKARIAESEKPAPKTAPKDHVHYHKDGSLWAKGQLAAGEPTGYWEWFRKDGTKLRSGHFENGKQVGGWITYDKKGEKHKVTLIRPKAKKDSGEATDRISFSQRSVSDCGESIAL